MDREAWRADHGVAKSWTGLIEQQQACERVQLSCEPTRCSNSGSHSKKLYSPFLLPHVWKFFSKPPTDHGST